MNVCFTILAPVTELLLPSEYVNYNFEEIFYCHLHISKSYGNFQYLLFVCCAQTSNFVQITRAFIKSRYQRHHLKMCFSNFIWVLLSVLKKFFIITSYVWFWLLWRETIWGRFWSVVSLKVTCKFEYFF